MVQGDILEAQPRSGQWALGILAWPEISQGPREPLVGPECPPEPTEARGYLCQKAGGQGLGKGGSFFPRTDLCSSVENLDQHGLSWEAGKGHQLNH